MTSSLQLGISAAKAGRMQEALTNLKDAIIEEPQNAEVWVWIAAIIDDQDKQVIFLEKALVLDPRNIPAQRGLAYLEKRKQDDSNTHDDHLSDYTHPISPFPPGARQTQVESPNPWKQKSDALINDLAESAEPARAEQSPTDDEKQGSTIKLTPFEIVLLGVVTLVFAFIGLLAASALFDFELPFNFLHREPKVEVTFPPSPGVFLFEDEDFLFLEQYAGLPTQDIGIPVSNRNKPQFVIWQSLADPDQMTLIHDTGEIIPFTLELSADGLFTVNPKNELPSGLFCFEQLPGENINQVEPFYWCFRVNLSQPIE